VTRGQLPEGRVARPDGGGAAAAVPPIPQTRANLLYTASFTEHGDKLKLTLQ